MTMGFPCVASSEQQVSVQAIEIRVLSFQLTKRTGSKERFAHEPITKTCSWDGLAINRSYSILPESMCFIHILIRSAKRLFKGHITILQRIWPSQFTLKITINEWGLLQTITLVSKQNLSIILFMTVFPYFYCTTNKHLVCLWKLVNQQHIQCPVLHGDAHDTINIILSESEADECRSMRQTWTPVFIVSQ